MHVATSNKIRAWLQGKKGERITGRPLEISTTDKKMEESKEEEESKLVPKTAYCQDVSGVWWPGCLQAS